ncbi:hypothetical protein GCM10023085_13070 [Actinomadura viridis]|uniref:DUF3618 domain-containing protein n=1 Tax=Actinomadura viridis TaxID=58110 RepID=A0A931GS87_9ACTN|nr:DUF3618 domain-containing protein [Actinomadura viridis]MBG6093681.1 hypothetical protein [Actinomadura viridis]
MADRSRDPEALERQIERTRRELAQTIDELADRVNPRNAAHRGAERLKDEAGQVVKAVNAMFTPPEREPGEDGEPSGVDPRLVLAGVGAAVAVTALVIWRRRRRRR